MYNNYYVFEKNTAHPTTENEIKGSEDFLFYSNYYYYLCSVIQIQKTFHLSLISIGYVYLKNSLSLLIQISYHRQVKSDRFFSVLQYRSSLILLYLIYEKFNF